MKLRTFRFFPALLLAALAGAASAQDAPVPNRPTPPTPGAIRRRNTTRSPSSFTRTV